MRDMIRYDYSSLEVRPVTGAKPAGTGSHSDQARFYLQHNDVVEAFAEIEQAEAQAKSENDPKLQASVLDLKGAAYMSTGEFEKAIDAYRQAMVLERSLNDLNGQAEMFLRVGWAYQSLEDYPKALGCYESARGFFEKSGDKGGAIRASLGIRSTYQSMGNIDRIEQAQNWVAMGASKDQAARIIAGDAQFFLAANHPSRALQSYEQALALLNSSSDPGLESRILAGMGRSETAVGLHEQAGKHLEAALSKMKSAGDREGEAATLASLGNLEVSTALSSSTESPKKHLRAALDRYSEALTMMNEIGDRGEEIGVLTGIGVTYELSKNYGDALNSYMEAIKLLELMQASTRLEEFPNSLTGKASELYERAIFSAMKLKRHEEAFNLTERSRASRFRILVGEADISARSTLAPKFVEEDAVLRRESVILERQLGQELSKPDADIDESRVLLLKTQLKTLRAQYVTLGEKLTKTAPKAAPYLTVSSLTLNEIQNKLDADTTLISYFPVSEGIVAFVVSKDHFETVELLSDDPDMWGSVVSLRGLAISLQGLSGQTDPSAVFKPLYKLLIKPIRHQLHTKALLLVPYGELYNVPFGALSPDGIHYLSDDYTVTYLPTASDVSYLGQKDEDSDKRMLVLAAAKLNGQSQVDALNGEAGAVASLYSSEPRVTSSAALSSFLREEGRKADLVHIVTGAETLPPGGTPDRRCKISLPAQKVAELDLTKTSLVVVSGWECEVGLFNEAFLYAGAHSVITSLWDVDDDAAKSFMLSFYTHLRSGKSKAESFGAAQLETRKSYPHPYYWAGFVLSGAGAGEAQHVSVK